MAILRYPGRIVGGDISQASAITGNLPQKFPCFLPVFTFT